jgi:hypothetical protein
VGPPPPLEPGPGLVGPPPPHYPLNILKPILKQPLPGLTHARLYPNIFPTKMYCQPKKNSKGREDERCRN